MFVEANVFALDVVRCTKTIQDIYDIHIYMYLHTYDICLYTLQYKKGVQIESIKHLMLSLKMELTMELCFLFFAVCFHYKSLVKV